TGASPRGVSMNAIGTCRCETRNSRPRLTAFLAAAAFMAAAGTVRAQTFRGAIVGTVIDQSQAPVPGAQVTVKNQATGLARTPATDDAGNYDVRELPMGVYPFVG